MGEEICFHSDEIRKLARPSYTATDIKPIEEFLSTRGVLSFRALRTGLFPAAQVNPATSLSGYHNVWVRDNVFVADAHYVNGRVDTAIRVTRSLATFFSKYFFRFDAIIAGTVDRKATMNRVHVRFNGERLTELPEKWSHAQNDALGYFVWLTCVLVSDGALPLADDGFALMEKFVAYFKAIRFWEDEDSGHWEEVRKINASSIGVVVGGLEAMKTMLETPAVRGRFDAARIARTMPLLVELIGCGRQALDQILPAECVQRDKQRFRPIDAALLFLIYPINVVGDEMAAKIVSDVETHLQGAIGVRRYIGDSYWCGDYRELLPPEKRSADFSNNLDERDRLLKPGEEAQWCIFDPILSIIHATRGVGTRAKPDMEKQTEYFNRSLGQITNAPQCPEAYFLERGQYAPNDNAPLLWTQANLWLALHFMKAAAA